MSFVSMVAIIKLNHIIPLTFVLKYFVQFSLNVRMVTEDATKYLCLVEREVAFKGYVACLTAHSF